MDKIERERLKFEKWIKAYYIAPFRMDRGAGKYFDLTVQSHWAAWRAALNL